MKLSPANQKFIIPYGMRSAILGLTLLAFLLRTYRLEAQSYWIEEAWTLYFAKLSVSELWHSLLTEEPKPPFYYFLTLYWIKLAGDGEYALRFLSLVFGVMAVPLTFRLGRALGDHRLGLLAALLMTVAPYQIWHSQEARMYSIFTAASVLSMWGFVKILPDLEGFPKLSTIRRSWRWWLVYVLGSEWAILIHYHALILIGIQGLFLLLAWRRYWRGYLTWGGALIVIFLLYVPWLLVGSALLQRFLHWLPQPALVETYVRGVQAYTVGEYMPRAEAVPLIGVFAAIYVLGLIGSLRRSWGRWRGWEMLAFLLSYTLAPNLATWLYGELRTPVYFERYLIPVQVGFLLTVAIGILTIYDIVPFGYLHFTPHASRFTLHASRFTPYAALVLLLTLLAINGYALRQHYFNPAYAKDDWRAVIRTIENFGLPGDAIVLTGDGGEKLFDYYYRGNLPLYRDFLLPAPPPAKARDLIAKIAATHRRIWYTPYGVDLDAALESWLAENAYPAWHSWLGRKRLALYDSSAAATGRLENINATFSDSPESGLTLTSVALAAEAVAAGDLLPLTLTWQTLTPLERDYQLSLRLVNDRGDIFTQSDWPPLAAAGGTSTWPKNQPIIDRRSLWLPPDIPPATYTLQLVIYDPTSGQPLGQPAVIPNIAVAPAPLTPPLTALSIPNPINNSPFTTLRDHSPLILLGYVLPEKIQPGQEMWLWLYWQASPVEGSASYPAGNDPALFQLDRGIVRVSLADGENSISRDFPLAESVGPLDSWQPGQVRRAVYHMPTSPRLTGQQAQVSVALVSGSGQVETETHLGQIALDTRPRQFEVPSIVNTLDINFGSPTQLKLIGYDLPVQPLAAGETLNVTLYWQAEAELERDYTVFVQLLNSAGHVVAQVDLPPLAGVAPTTTWLPGEILTDPYTLPLPATLPPGDYRLITGLYHAASGERVSIPYGMRSAITSGGNFVELALIKVK